MERGFGLRTHWGIRRREGAPQPVNRRLVCWSRGWARWRNQDAGALACRCGGDAGWRVGGAAAEEGGRDGGGGEEEWR